MHSSIQSVFVRAEGNIFFQHLLYSICEWQFKLLKFGIFLTIGKRRMLLSTTRVDFKLGKNRIGIAIQRELACRNHVAYWRNFLQEGCRNLLSYLWAALLCENANICSTSHLRCAHNHARVIELHACLIAIECNIASLSLPRFYFLIAVCIIACLYDVILWPRILLRENLYPLSWLFYWESCSIIFEVLLSVF